MQELEADYLVVGSGAMGMAFTDVLMTESDAKVVIVDRHHQPGGHWHDAYPYVRLHQPSAFYGVNSKHLGSDAIDHTGWNKCLYELATNSEVCAYFDQVMQQQFLPSGRVSYFPMCEYTGDGEFHSLVADAKYRVSADKWVDATYMNVTVPAMRPPKYQVAAGVHCQPPNSLPRVAGQYQRYVVVGAGKTGMDACLFLLKNNLSADDICWIMPRDPWMLDRANIQPGSIFSDSVAHGFALQTKAIADADDIPTVFAKVAQYGQLLRFDDAVEPSMYRCATVTRAELAQLRSIKNIVRMGHVQRIDTDQIQLAQGNIKTDLNTLHVDCSADGLQRRPATPVFENNKITLQSVRTCQQVFSAAFIGHIEAAYSNRSETERNALCTPVPHPDSHIDFLRTTLTTNLNAVHWAAEPELQTWLQQARLDGFSSVPDPDRTPDPEQLQALEQMQGDTRRSIENLHRLLDELNAD